ncbi:hypothetical protein PAXRUDRAFT_149664, partial [Paxillus rubicundulus Ve08.2h10]
LSGSGPALLSDLDMHGEQSSDIHQSISLFNSGQLSAWAVRELWSMPLPYLARFPVAVVDSPSYPFTQVTTIIPISILASLRDLGHVTFPLDSSKRGGPHPSILPSSRR